MVSSRPRLARIAFDARAKLNLTLAVGPRRDDGFHDLVTVFQSVTLADTLIAEPRARGFSLRIRYEDASTGGQPAVRGAAGCADPGDLGSIPAGPDNLVLRAAHSVARELGLVAGARFTLIKRIPAGSGLGGGSADAAAVLRALPALFGMRLPPSRARALALALGSDVPFALAGGTALGTGRGETLRRLELDGPFEALLAVPRWRVSTASAFRRIERAKYGLTPREATLLSSQILGRKRLSAAPLMRLGNTFEKVLGDRRSDFDSLGVRLLRAGAVAFRMTGSGSAVFAVLGPGSPIHDVAGCFTGSETLYAVRSARTGLRRHAVA